MKKHRFALVGIALLLMTVAGFVESQKTHAAPSGLEVKIDNFSFNPSTITVKTGTQITWTNQDDVPHTVVSDMNNSFKSRVLDTDEKFSFIPKQRGTYSYFCSIHPKMTGKIVVQ